MKRIRIIQAGYQNFTGEMGHIEFKDGVSVHRLNDDFVRSLSGIVRTEVVLEPAQAAPVETPPEQTPPVEGEGAAQ